MSPWQISNLFSRFLKFSQIYMEIVEGRQLAAAAKSLQSCPTLCDPTEPTRLRCPWDSPGKNTGVGCHILLQCMKVKRESEVAQLCPTLNDPMDRSLPGSSMGFSRQEYWSGVPSPSPLLSTAAKSLQSCPTLCNPIDGSPPGSAVPGILQPRTQ